MERWYDDLAPLYRAWIATLSALVFGLLPILCAWITFTIHGEFKDQYWGTLIGGDVLMIATSLTGSRDLDRPATFCIGRHSINLCLHCCLYGRFTQVLNSGKLIGTEKDCYSNLLAIAAKRRLRALDFLYGRKKYVS